MASDLGAERPRGRKKEVAAGLAKGSVSRV